MAADIPDTAMGHPRRFKLLGMASFLVFATLSALTLLLIAFRLVHFRSANYDILVAGYRIGRIMSVLIWPALVIQILGLVAGFVAYRGSGLAKIGVIGGFAVFLSIGVIWANLREIMIDDLQPAVSGKMALISKVIEKQYDQNGKLPETLASIDDSADGHLVLNDPYDPGHGLFHYHVLDKGFVLLSVGPDRCNDVSRRDLTHEATGIEQTISQHTYDPTNGVPSQGDLIVWSAFPK